MAPEVLQKQPTTAASDVYAWAVTVNEIATGIFPFADCTKDNPQCQTVLNFGYGRSACSLLTSVLLLDLWQKNSHPAHDVWGPGSFYGCLMLHDSPEA
jgi:serine/threonine protein kinase